MSKDIFDSSIVSILFTFTLSIYLTENTLSDNNIDQYQLSGSLIVVMVMYGCYWKYQFDCVPKFPS